MSEYYLISQLPSLDGLGENVPVPITEESFVELCGRFLSQKVYDKLKGLTLAPSRNAENSGSDFIDKWNDGERRLRLALANARAGKLGKQFDDGTQAFTAEVLQTARAAVEMQDPLQAEVFLNNYRVSFLETLRPMDSFSENFVFYYALKLKLLLRVRRFDQKAGQAAYRNIYNSILNGENREAVQ